MGPLVREPVALPSSAAAVSTADGPALRVGGSLPPGLRGAFLAAGPHPAHAHRPDHPDVLTGPVLVSGVRLGGGAAHAYRATAERGATGLLGPVPALAPALRAGQGPDGRGPVALSRPVADAGGRWHSIATYPGLGYAEHVVADARGAVLSARPFPLPGAPLVAAALTDSHVVLFDGPVAHGRAAALVGERFPYARRAGRPSRLGLLGLAGDEPSVRWFPVAAGHVHDVVDAREEDGRVVVDAVLRPFGGEGPAALRRWVVDPATGDVAERDLVPGADAAAVTGRFLHATRNTGAGAELVRYDTATGRADVRRLGAGTVAGLPRATAGHVLLPVERVAERRGELLVLDAGDLRAPAAVVQAPRGLATARRTAWLTG
ncbi:carotenoid oxygenase family protein [Saccharothrix sp. Mg75]|uniref:carotenoid oxygenase family protein n=1 Tax=Saccharothrix sp. Mg75 TaxID=3445357 RepID=UPI003EEA0BD2